MAGLGAHHRRGGLKASASTLAWMSRKRIARMPWTVSGAGSTKMVGAEAPGGHDQQGDHWRDVVIMSAPMPSNGRFDVRKSPIERTIDGTTRAPAAPVSCDGNHHARPAPRGGYEQERENEGRQRDQHVEDCWASRSACRGAARDAQANLMVRPRSTS